MKDDTLVKFNIMTIDDPIFRGRVPQAACTI